VWLQVISLHSWQEVTADSGNFPWYMTDSTAVLEDSYSKVVVWMLRTSHWTVAALLRWLV